MVDLHTHSNISDGILNPIGLISYAVEQNLSAIALTDHDSTDGIDAAAKQAELAPTAVKEEKKGISARLMKVEQLTGKKDEPKGISAALAAAEQQKIQEAKERVVAESKGKYNPADRVMKPLNPEQESRIETLVKGKESATRKYWRQAAARRQYKKAG